MHAPLCVNLPVGKKYNDTEHSQMPGHWVNRCRAGRTWAVSLCPFARVCSAVVASCCQPKSRSREGSWEESMPWWSTVHPWGPCWLYQAAPALLSGGGEAGRREQSLQPHHSVCNLNSNAFELGRTLCYKCCHHSLPVISKMSRFCAILSYDLGLFPICIVCETHLFLKCLTSHWDMPCVGKRNQHWLQYDMCGKQN